MTSYQVAAISSLGQDMRVVGCMVASGSLEHDVSVGDWFVISSRLLKIKKVFKLFITLLFCAPRFGKLRQLELTQTSNA